MLSQLNNQELDLKIKSLAGAERKLLAEVIEHIKEADLRKLYLEYGYPNLYEYLVQACGYPGGSAQRRIDAARLLSVEPKLSSKILSGEINLTQTSILQQAIREKSKSAKVSVEQKRSLIEKISDKTSAETQVIISKELDVKLKEKPKETHQKDESVRLEITLTKKQWEKLKKARDLASNATQSNDWSALLEYFSDKLIKQKEGPVATLAVKKSVLKRDQVCQYKTHTSKQVCGSRWNLHIDHIKPKWAGGTTDPNNLRVLCQKHNHHIYKQQAGIRTGSREEPKNLTFAPDKW